MQFKWFVVLVVLATVLAGCGPSLSKKTSFRDHDPNGDGSIGRGRNGQMGNNLDGPGSRNGGPDLGAGANGLVPPGMGTSPDDLNSHGMGPLSGGDEKKLVRDRRYIVFFDFDQSTVKASEQPKIAAFAAELQRSPANKAIIEGHCDERGSAEYNRGLGERRALAVRDALVAHGVESERVKTISYGSEKPDDPGHDDRAYQLNRRAEQVQELP